MPIFHKVVSMRTKLRKEYSNTNIKQFKLNKSFISSALLLFIYLIFNAILVRT